MKKIYFLLLILTSITNAQNFQWADFPAITYTLNPTLIGYTTTCDSAGNVYSCGFKDTQFSSGDMYGQLFYRKYSTSGTLIFEKLIAGKARVFNMTADSNGNIYVAASFKTIMTIGATIISGGSSEMPILLKFDSSGNLLWHKLISDFNTSDHLSALAVDNSDNVYIGYDNFFVSQITKLNSAGMVQFSIVQQNVKIISSLSIDNIGNIYAAGSCAQSNSMFAGVAQPTTLAYGNYVVKYSSTGVHQWTRFMEDITCIDPQLSVKTPNEVYVSSTLSGAFTFGTLTAQGPSSGSSDDIFITKLNANGDFIWLREVPGTGKASVGKRNFMTSDANGNVYFVGSTKGTTNWTPVISTTISGFSNDIILLKYNSNGDLLMAKTAGGSGDDRADGVSVDANENIFITGMAAGTVTFDGITGSLSGNAPYIAKIGTTLGIVQNDNAKNYIYPNPVNNEIYFSKSFQNKEITICNTIGEIIKITVVAENETVNVSELPSGIYFLKTKDNLTFKIVKK